MIKLDKRRKKFFDEQYWYAENFLTQYLDIEDYKGLNILEVGCAESGALFYYYKNGANCYGVEIAQGRYEIARQIFSNEQNAENVKLYLGDITDTELVKSLPSMDFIILRDVIEHIPDKLSALNNLRKLLKKSGSLFISYPPKFSPYAGHQQNIKKKYFRLPFMHLLPKSIYKKVLQMIKTPQHKVNEYLEIKELAVSISAMENLFKKSELSIKRRDLYLIRPCFEKRFGLRAQKTIFNKIYGLKEFFSLGALYILTKKQ